MDFKEKPTYKEWADFCEKEDDQRLHISMSQASFAALVGIGIIDCLPDVEVSLFVYGGILAVLATFILGKHLKNFKIGPFSFGTAAKTKIAEKKATDPIVDGTVKP